MTAYSIFQAFVVTLVVLACVVSLARRLAPRTVARLRSRLGAWMSREGHAAWLQAAGRRIGSVAADGGSCASGCGSCGTCGPSEPAPGVIRIERHR